MSKLSLLITYARCQRTVAYITAGAALNIRKGVYSSKEKSGKSRWVNFQKTEINRFAQCMNDVVKCRPQDIEETSNSMLSNAINRLSETRLNRIEYAGRVLP